jgi:hypothetical protein
MRVKHDEAQIGLPIAASAGLFAAATPMPRSIIRVALSICSSVFRAFSARASPDSPRVAHHLLSRLRGHRRIQVQKDAIYTRRAFSPMHQLLKETWLSDLAIARCAERPRCRSASALRHGYHDGRRVARGLHGRPIDNSGTPNPDYDVCSDRIRRNSGPGF